jgi:hypothetical protein
MDPKKISIENECEKERKKLNENIYGQLIIGLEREESVTYTKAFDQYFFFIFILYWQTYKQERKKLNRKYFPRR